MTRDLSVKWRAKSTTTKRQLGASWTPSTTRALSNNHAGALRRRPGAPTALRLPAAELVAKAR